MHGQHVEPRIHDPGPTTSPTPVVAVVGQTATGKSDLALDLAECLGGEIVNADASQLYAGMDIGTAKVPVLARRGIPHHQLDVLDIRQEASVAAYQRHARGDIAAIRRRGRVPILVGGSGLYVRAALDDLRIPPTDPAVRARLEAELAGDGAAAAHARLAEVDPAAAALIDPRNGRRVVRALEVVELTGRPFSASMPQRRFVSPAVLLAIAWPPADLDARIESRVRQMWRAGLVDEVHTLLGRGLRQGPTASRALGYQQVLRQLDGELTPQEAMDDTAAATRRLARRQRSWFGADDRVRWLPADAPGLARRAVSLLQRTVAGPG